VLSAILVLAAGVATFVLLSRRAQARHPDPDPGSEAGAGAGAGVPGLSGR
jgi:hypothetical protein